MKRKTLTDTLSPLVNLGLWTSSLLLASFILAGCSSSDSAEVVPADTNSPVNTELENTDLSALTTPTSAWEEVAQLVPPNPGDEFDNVVLDGDAALVAGSGSEDGFSGVAYYFERDGDGAWQNLARLEGDSIGRLDSFGSFLALSGNTALIAAPGDDSFGNVSGAGYIFERQEDNQWLQVARITNDIGGIKTIALEGNRALLGGSDFAGRSNGAAYIYEREPNGVWLQMAILTPSDVTGFDLLGVGGGGLALSGDTAMVSSPRDSKQFDDAGSVYVFKRNSSGIWEEVAKLTASDASADDYFGASVSLQGNRAVIGRFNFFNSFGASTAYIFERNDAGEWVEITKLTVPFATNGTEFGRKVSMFGDRVLVGAPGIGSAFLFEHNIANQWNLIEEFSNDVSGSSLGWSVSLMEGRALISDANEQGVVYVFEEGM